MRNIRTKTKILTLKHPLIMGVLNVTPDSFSDGGKFFTKDRALEHAHQMVHEGADIIDIGGESTRPDANPISLEEERRRVLPVVEALRKQVDVPLSIDTTKPEVADQCLALGADILNDVTGLNNLDMLRIAAAYNAPTIIMHMQGNPKTMQENPVYGDIISEIKEFLRARASRALSAGVEQVIIDPGIGFGKTPAHNLAIIKRLSEFTELGYPVLVGPSRKSHIGVILRELDTLERLEGTLAEVAISVLHGADIVRVHDVVACKRAVRIATAIRDA